MAKSNLGEFSIPSYVEHILELDRQIMKLEMMARPSGLGSVIEEMQSRQWEIERIMTQSIISPEFIDFLKLNMVIPEVSSLSSQILRHFTQADIVKSYSLFNSLVHSHTSQMEDLLKSHQRIKNIQELIAIRHIDTAAAHHIESVLSMVEASARVYSKIDVNLWSSALSNAHAYQHFAERQLSKLLKENDQVAKRRAIVTNMLGGIAQSCQCTFEIGLSMSSGEKQIIYPIPKPNLYGFANQSLAFIYRAGVDIDAGNALERALPSRITKLGQGIILAVYQINKLSQCRKKGEIIKPTSKMLMACSLIPTRIARGREDFGEIVDNLFFLLYEGSGSDNCRLCNIVDDEMLNPLWRIKHLRLDFRHDVDHGKDAPRKHGKIADAYRSLIGKETPITSKDWSEAQHCLYSQLLNMLNEIIKIQETKDLA